jgi:uncharacterized repeat protein (TIGR01451 family)
MHRLATTLLLLLLLAALPAHGAITFDNTPSGGSAASTNIELIRDTAGGAPSGQYVGLRISSSTALKNVYARATVGGTGYALDATQAQDVFVGDLGTTARTVYWFINLPASTANGTFEVSVYAGGPPGTGTSQGTSTSYVLRSADVDQSASANKIASSSVPASIQLGQSFNAVVCYGVNSSTGSNIQIGPASISGFDPAALQLLDVPSVQTYGSSDCSGSALNAGVSNQLYYTGIGNNSVNSLRATYTFRAMSTGSATLSPIVSARSGQYKYNSDFSSGISVQPPANTAVLAKSVDVAGAASAITVTYTVTASNGGANAVTLDRIVDTLPSSPATVGYVAGSARWNGVTIADPLVSGTQLTWGNPGGATAFVVPAGGSASLTFQATVPGTAGVYTNRAIAQVGAVQIDTTLATSDNAPASASTRIGQAVLDVAKTALTPSITTTAAAGGSAQWTLSVTNNGGSAADGVSITDTLPAGFSFASNTAPVLAGGATRTASVDPAAGAATPAWGTFRLPAGASVSITFTASVAGSVASGTYSNSASASTSTTPSTVNAFNGSASNADDVTVTRMESPTIAKTFVPGTIVAGQNATLRVTIANPNAAAITGAAFSDAYPSGLSNTGSAVFDAASASAGCSGSLAGAAGGTSLALSGGSIPANASCVIEVAVTSSSSAPTTHTNPAFTLATANAGSANAAAANLQVLARASIAQAFSPASITAGDTSTLTFTLGNDNAAALDDARFTEVLNNVSVASITIGGTCSGSANTPPLALGATALDLRVPSLPPGGCTLTLTVTSSNVGAWSHTTSGVTTVQTLAGAPSNSATLTVTAAAGSGVQVSGTVYADANHDARRDGAEAGTGLVLYAKLVAASSPGGPALQAAAVDPASGAFAFSGVAAGTYTVLIDDNATLADVAPTVPVAWTGTQAASGVRSNVAVAAVDVSGLDFGLFSGNRVSGRVFADNGSGGAIANNGVREAGEAGVAGATLRLVSGATTIESTTSDGDGRWTLWVAASWNGQALKVVQDNLAGWLSTGGSPAAGYDRASDSHAFVHAAGSDRTGLDFGDVRIVTLTANQSRAALPGSSVVYAHRFEAGSAGSVTFGASGSTPWPAVPWRDVDCNGAIDGADAPVAGAIAVAGSDAVCVLVVVAVPAGAPSDARERTTLRADFAYANAAPALAATLTNDDTTTVLAAGSGALALRKSQDNAAPLPGTRITYTLAYTNLAASPLRSIRVADATPPYTRFVSAACTLPLPAGVSACSVTASPAVGATGAIEWTLVGDLLPAAGGGVSFTVELN